MIRSLAPLVLVAGLVAPGAAAAPEPSSALLGQGCAPSGVLRGDLALPALMPCGVEIAPDGSTRIAQLPVRIAAPGAEAAAEPGWSRLARPSPTRRVNVAMAYLPALGGVVMYGGLVCPGLACSPVDETWLWDGTTWSRLKPPSSPPPLHAPAMTYDPVRRELVLFGGETCSPSDCFFSSDTWTFDGITWERQDVALAPPASAASAIAFDAISSRVILSGGCAQDRCPGLVGTWSWDGSAWRLEDLLTPLPRIGAAMATNPGGGVVLFGGTDPRGPTLAETWVWDGEWEQRQPATSPPSRMYAGATLDADRGEVVLFAGSTVTCPTPFSCSGSYRRDTWTWNGQTWTERPSEPLPRGGQSLAIAYDPARREVVRFGGISNFNNHVGASTTAYESSTWLWDRERWRELRSPMPEERVQGAMGFHPAAEVLVLVGGYCVYTPTCDSWTWDGERWTLIDARAPGPNSRASMIPDPASESLLMPLADALWSLGYDPEAETWSWSAHQGSAAPVPGGWAAAGDRSGSAIMFGAQICSPCTYSDRTFRWRGGPWEDVAVAAAPPGRAFATMTLEPRSGQTVLFGGLTNGGQQYFSDTWTWDGTAWTQSPATGPRNRAFTRIAADPATGDVLLLGGISGPPEYAVLSDQWLFDGEGWRQVAGGGPGPRIEHALAGYPTASQTVLYGGQDANPGRPMSDTWIWSGQA